MVNRELETLEVRKQQTTYIASNIMYLCTVLGIMRYVTSRVHNIYREESVLLYNRLYKRVA